jgi:hypothetical protein
MRSQGSQSYQKRFASIGTGAALFAAAFSIPKGASAIDGPGAHDCLDLDGRVYGGRSRSGAW